MTNSTPEQPNARVSGLHHVTAIASDPRANLSFYTDVLGQRLVKKTVNFDDPGTYHLYFGNATGDPGTIMTFFPWPGARRGSVGAGQPSLTSYAVPLGSLDFWHDRLRSFNVHVEEPTQTFGDATLPFADPDGMRLALVESETAEQLAAWRGTSAAPVEEQFALRGLRGVTLQAAPDSGTNSFLTETMGLERIAESRDFTRYRLSGGPLEQVLDVAASEEFGSQGAGSIHHVAFRVPDDASQLVWQRDLAAAGSGVSPVMDREYFHSIYFREPGGVLFEIATDPPGFTADEPIHALGRELKLPGNLEGSRRRIEAALPALKAASSATP